MGLKSWVLQPPTWAQLFSIRMSSGSLKGNLVPDRPEHNPKHLPLLSTRPSSRCKIIVSLLPPAGLFIFFFYSESRQTSNAWIASQPDSPRHRSREGSPPLNLIYELDFKLPETREPCIVVFGGLCLSFMYQKIATITPTILYYVSLFTRSSSKIEHIRAKMTSYPFLYLRRLEQCLAQSRCPIHVY